MGQSDLIVFSSGEQGFSRELERGYNKVAVVSCSKNEKFNDMLWDYREEGIIDVLILINGDYEQEDVVEFLDKIMYSDSLTIKNI